MNIMSQYTYLIRQIIKCQHIDLSSDDSSLAASQPKAILEQQAFSRLLENGWKYAKEAKVREADSFRSITGGQVQPDCDWFTEPRLDGLGVVGSL